MMEKIDHIGIAVTDLEAQIAIYRDQLGMELEGVEEVPSQMAKVAFFKVGDSRVELVQPLSPESAIAKSIAKRGEGMHHIAYSVPDIHAAMALARSRGMETVTAEPKPGAHHSLVCFLHPKSTGGVLTELVQPGGHQE